MSGELAGRPEDRPTVSGRVSGGLALGLGAVVLVGLVALDIAVMRKPKRSMSKVTVGSRDEVYFSNLAWKRDAEALGQTLQQIGFFRDVGATVLYSKDHGVRAVSFVVPDDAWSRADTVAAFEEIGRRVGPTAGGFPIEVRLVDSGWSVRKSIDVGKVIVGARDTVYYLGSATESEAKALGQALRDVGYLQDLGVTVEVSRDNGTVLGFVVSNGVWDRPEAVASFQNLAQRVAASVGGLPVAVRLLSPQMEVMKQWIVQ
ncbi:MAG TPA: hypothetical protein VGF16_20200 [Bryobacteraceae bacterium]|jgi:hypothetical protein